MYLHAMLGRIGPDLLDLYLSLGCFTPDHIVCNPAIEKSEENMSC
jgi:hypothetical protein